MNNSVFQHFISAGLLICLFFNSTLLFQGCHYQNQKTEKDFEYYNNTLEATPDSLKLVVITKIDSVYLSEKTTNLKFKLMRYSAKAEYFGSQEGEKNKQIAMKNVDSLISLCKQHLTDNNVIKKYVWALNYKGKLLAAKDDYNEAIRYFSESKNAFHTYLKDSCEIELTNNLPDLFFVQNDYRAAISEYQKNIHLALTCQPLTFQRFSIVQNALNSIGLCFANLNAVDTANIYLDSALNFINRNENRYTNANFINLARGVVYNTKANLLRKTRQPAEAEKLYRQSIRLVEADYPFFAIDTRRYLAKTYLLQKDFPKARKILDTISVKLDSIQASNLYYRDFYLLNAEYYEMVRSFDSALANHKRYTQYQQKENQRLNNLFKLDINRELERREHIAQNQVLMKDISLKGFQLTIAVLICCIAVLTIVFVWNYYKRSVRHVVELEKLSKEINEKHQLLQHSFVSLEDSHAENTRLLKTVAHDLKNPIGGIKTLVHSMQKSFQIEAFRTNFELISNTCKNLMDTIDEILTDRKVLLPAQKEWVDISWLMESCAELLKEKAEEKQLLIIVDAKPAYAEIKREGIWRVISNLTHNAMKFSRKGNKIELTVSEQQDGVLLMVKDYGVGIPPGVQQGIFDPNDLSKSRTGTAGESSYGLGLSICKKIVDEHSGKIWFESEEGKGTTFYVRLPVH